MPNIATINEVTNVISVANGFVFHRLVYGQQKELRDGLYFVMGKIMFQLPIV